MLDAAVYSMMGIHWFYTMVALNLLLHRLAVGAAGANNRARVPATQPGATVRGGGRGRPRFAT
jgi:hypothetical protein